MIFCKELNKEFNDKKELFKALAENESFIIAQKKLETKSINKGAVVCSNQNSIKK